MLKISARTTPLRHLSKNTNSANSTGQLVKRGVLLLLSVSLFACASVDNRFADAEHRAHPAMKVFLDYDKAAKNSDEFNEKLIAFFSASDQKRIAATMGWQKLVYTSSYRALKDGECEEIAIAEKKPSRVSISCKGPFTFRSAFGYKREETMELRVSVREVAGQWYIGTSGMRHTMDGGESVPRSTGIKFK